MKIAFSDEEKKLIRVEGFNLKEDLSEDELFELDRLIADKLPEHFDGDEPLPTAMIYEGILDKIAEA